jgi:hypothetical protein
LAVLLSCGPFGCKRAREASGRPTVISIDVTDRSPEPVFSSDAVVARASAALGKEHVFDVALKGDAHSQGWRCTVEIAAAKDEGGASGSVLRALSVVECKPVGAAGADVLSARAMADKPVSDKDGSLAPQVKMRELGLRLVEDTVLLLVRQQSLRTGPTAAVVTALQDPDADVRRQAVRAAAWRRLREAVPPLVALLSDPQEDLRDMALGALTDIGDPAAVKAITARVKFSDVEELRKIIDPIAAMGGEEARTFLEFVGSGHEDPEIRKMAHLALERMDRRAQAGR